MFTKKRNKRKACKPSTSSQRTASPPLPAQTGSGPPPYSRFTDDQVLELVPRLPVEEQYVFRRAAKDDRRRALDNIHFALAIGTVVVSFNPVGFANQWQRRDRDDRIDFMLAAHTAGVRLLSDPAFSRFAAERPDGDMIDSVTSFIRQRNTN